MTFSTKKRGKIKEAAGYYCQICGEWNPPEKGDIKSRLEAHSTDRTHKDDGVAVCSRPERPCHDKIHQITNDPDQIARITVTAVNLNNLSMAYRLLDIGVPEKRIVRVLNRVGRL